ncbi:MAG: M20/M25/M40 family metallo-hydrolase [Gemmatimonadales bacterium]|nr:M20/M25/M40 family metallo-hydrolase [Gemmatimonadales bacterium]
MRVTRVLPLALPLALLALSTTLPAQRPDTDGRDATRAAQAASATVMRAHLEFLADDALEGRKPGTRGGELAALYIKAQFERLGLQPAGEDGTYYQKVPIITLTPTPSLAVGKPGDAAATLRYPADYVLWSMRDTTSVRLSGDLVFVGHGIVAPKWQWNDYEGVNAKGKVVVVLANDPGLRDSTIFRGKILTYYGRWTYKIEEARRQGAAGILLVHTTETATYPWTTVQSSWTGPQVRVEQPAASLLVAGWLEHEAAAKLFAASGHDFDSLAASAYRRGFTAVPLGARATAAVTSQVRRSETQNVLARLPGRGRLAEEAVLIGGHYDHFGIGAPVNGDSIYNGAEDNASGTAAVLAAAEAFVESGVRTRRSLVFIAFAAEEAGLLGSQAFVNRPTIPLKQIAAILNLDVMNLYGRTRDASALGNNQSTLGEAFTRAAAAEGLRVTVDEDALIRGGYFRSDHFPFARAGVPGTSIEGGDAFVGKPEGYGQQQRDEYVAKRYHQPSDQIQPWWSYDGGLQQLRVTMRMAVDVADAASTPTWSRGSEFREVGEARRR